jgi:hypothetical protein
MVQFIMNPGQTRPKPSFVRYASVAGPDNVSRSSAVLAFFVPLVRVLKKKLKTNIRSAGGTPVDSLRFRQALVSSRQAQ